MASPNLNIESRIITSKLTSQIKVVLYKNNVFSINNLAISKDVYDNLVFVKD